MTNHFLVRPIGHLRSPLRAVADAPKQGPEGEVEADYADTMRQAEVS